MKHNKGVTLTSLTVYIIVLALILVLFTFISANYTSQISDVSEKGKISNEIIKLYSFIVSDTKSSASVLEFSDNFVRFENDSQYSIRYVDLNGSANEKMQYEIYRNGVLISDNLLDASFDYDPIVNLFSLNVKYIYGKNVIEKSQSFKVQKGNL